MPLKVLIIEDEEGVRRICERAIAGGDYQATLLSRGDDALSRLGEDWDIVITDLNMPGKTNGLDVCRRTRAVGAADVLVMTGAPDMDTAIEALRIGAYDYLVKPFTPAELISAVGRCAEKRRLSVELAREKALRAELEKAERVMKTFGQFVTPEVAQFVLQQGLQKGTRALVTVMFVDVRRFTPFAMASSPEEVVEALNGIFAPVIEAVRREGGILNKFMGDGLLAIFGAPLDLPDHAAAAARSALRARDAVDALSQERQKRGRQPLRLGIGINTGDVVAGCLGSEERTEYSVIGHAVNLAARLEEAADPGQILVGPATASRLPPSIGRVPHPPIRLAGIADPVPVFELAGGPSRIEDPRR